MFNLKSALVAAVIAVGALTATAATTSSAQAHGFGFGFGHGGFGHGGFHHGFWHRHSFFRIYGSPCLVRTVDDDGFEVIENICE